MYYIITSEPAFLDWRIPVLCAIYDITLMARGPSNRIVVVLDDSTLKRDLHAALAADDITMKDWFQERAVAYLAARTQPPLTGFVAVGDPAAANSGSRHVV